jgi:hypothetical protein
MKLATRCFGALAIVAAAAGCQGEDSASGAAAQPANEPATQAPAPARTADAARTGSIEIDGQAWNVVPAIQCGIYPGPVVAIAGHAAEDEAIEITIDYDSGGLIQAAVENPDGSLAWRSSDGSLSVSVEGDVVTGRANFTSSAGGSTATEQGTFKVNCG